MTTETLDEHLSEHSRTHVGLRVTTHTHTHTHTHTLFSLKYVDSNRGGSIKCLAL